MTILSIPSCISARRPGRWRGTVLVLLSAFAFSTAGLFTRLFETDVWTMLFWRDLFGGLLIAGYVVWRDGPLAMAALRRIGRPGLVAAGCSTAATICFINALRETSVADVLVINATAPFITAGHGLGVDRRARAAQHAAGQRRGAAGCRRHGRAGAGLPDLAICWATCWRLL